MIYYYGFIYLLLETMEKLIKLLNEYEKEVKKSEKVWSIDNDWDICRQTYEWVDYNEYTKYMNTNNLISKSFWFIKYLVKNDKIDFKYKNYLLKSYDWYFDDDILCIVNQDCNTYENRIKVEFNKIDSLIMILSIQDNPLEFLCSILK